MGYQILRFEKIKTRQSLEGRCKHATRERQPQNADPTLKGENRRDRTTQETLEAFDRRLAELRKIRKDNVRAVEILVAFSPSEAARLSKIEQDHYFADAKAWFVRLFGGPKNLLNTTIHADEHTSRHMTMFVMPIETVKDEQTGKEQEEKFNCKHWLGGAKRLSLLQTRFHDDVAGRYGLERGILGSKAKHQEVDRFYANVRAAAEDALLPDADPPKHHVLRDPNDEIKEAVEKRDAQLQPQITALAAQAREADLLRKQNKSLRRTLAEKDKQIARLDEEIKGLRKWIQNAQEALIEGGTKLAAFRDRVVRGYKVWQEQLLAKRQDRHREQGIKR
jgi:predicted  nucleic acid-binding Zn-ribbon protein